MDEYRSTLTIGTSERQAEPSVPAHRDTGADTESYVDFPFFLDAEYISRMRFAPASARRTPKTDFYANIFVRFPFRDNLDHLVV